MSKRKRNNIFVYVLLVVSLTFVAVAIFFAFSNEKPLEVVKYDVIFEVLSRRAGIDLNNTVLTFGIVNPGGGAKREIIISNNYDFPVNVRVFVSENLLGLIKTEREFFVDAGEEIRIDVELDIPDDFEEGRYTGEIEFRMYE